MDSFGKEKQPREMICTELKGTARKGKPLHLQLLIQYMTPVLRGMGMSLSERRKGGVFREL